MTVQQYLSWKLITTRVDCTCIYIVNFLVSMHTIFILGPGRVSERNTRRQRKLPSMPHTRRVQEFWPTFRGAVDWMQKHHETIETALNLLEIYPKLIQHRSCDRLWEFISKVAYLDKQEATNNNNKVEKGKDSTSKMVKDSNIPSISVTGTKDDKPRGEDINSVYVCGDMDDEQCQSLVLGLLGRFSIRSSNEVSGKVPKGDLNTIINADTFVFVMNAKTVTDIYYLNRLETALAWKMAVTFVRDPSFVLPDTLPNAVINVPRTNYIDDINNVAPTFSRASSAKERHIYNASRQETRPVSTSCIDNYEQSVVDLRLSRPSSSVSKTGLVSSASLSLPTLPDISIQKPLFHKSDSHSMPNTAVKPQAHTAEHMLRLREADCAPQSLQLNLSDILTKGYAESILYSRLYHNECLERLITMITNGADLSESTTFIKPPMINHSNKIINSTNEFVGDAIGAAVHHLQDLPKEAKENLNEEKRMSLESERLSDNGLPDAVETIYLVYSENKAQPERVHWPIEEHCTVTESPSIESIGFQDVDLSKNVNQIDLASSDDSIDLACGFNKDE